MAGPYRPPISNINDLNTSVQCIIRWMASNGQFPDPATVQYNLANFHPDSVDFLARSRINPEYIPAIKEHKKLIQITNAKFWGYAMVNPVVTLDDLNRLLSNLHLRLGPIYCIPVTKQIFGVREFHPAIISVFMNNESCDIYRPSVNYIMDEIFQCYLHNRPSEPFGSNTSTVWWEAVFTRHFLARLHDPSVPNDRIPLDVNSMKFSRLNVYGIRIKGFVTLLESLRSSLSPGNFICASRRAHGMIESDIKRLIYTATEDFMNESAVANLRRQKPKSALLLLSQNSKALYQKLMEYSEERNFTWPSDFMDSLLSFAEFLENVAIRGPLRPLLHLVLTFADYSSNDFAEIFNRLGDVHREKALVDVVRSFNNFFDSFLVRVREESADPHVPWQQLADLEKQLTSTPHKSLLNLLASTSDQDYSGPKPNCLSVCGSLVVKQPQMDEPIETELKPVTEEIDNFPRLRNFLRHLTFLAERSVEVLLEISAQNLNIPRSPSAMQTIRCILTDLSISSTNPKLLIHPQEYRFLTPRGGTDVRMPSELCTQNSSVLRLLASCPVLQDPEIWSLWSYCSSSSLASHWGPLEEFLSDIAIDGEMSEKYDLAVVKLVNHGYLRLSTNGTLDDLSSSLAQCTSENSQTASSAAIKLCDLMIGSVLLVSRFIPPAECIRLLSSELISLSEDLTWRGIIRSVLLTMPLSLLGVVFSKILHPAMADNLIILEEAEGIEDILKFSVGSSLYDHLVTAIGVVGGQLGWSRWLEVFKNQRLSYTPQPHFLSPTRRTSLKVFKTQRKRKSLLLNSPKVEKMADTVEVDVAEFEVPTSEMNAEPVETVAVCREFIEDLRRKEFGLGVDLDAEASSLVQRFESRLNRSLDYLSRQLYGQPGHFMLELIQNADDNDYAPGVTPTVHFHLSNSALIVLNNESVGFTQADISALCDVGLSTKTENREEKIGRKGIGFKSVFAICEAPEVHSNGFHVRFGCLGDKQRSTTILTPEWITTLTDEDQGAWRTLIRLPFSSAIGQGPSSVLSYARNLLNHHLILFLRRVDSIVFQTSENLPDSLDLNLRRESRVLHSLGGPDPSVLKLFTITETRDGLQRTSKWLLLRHRFAVDVEKLSKIAGSSGSIPRRTNIAIAIPLSSPDFFPTFPVYAFLPIRNVGFKFLLNADFDLTSSREDIDGTSVWNQFLVSQIPDVFKSLIDSVIQIQSFGQLPLSRSEILGRILECLPLNTRGSISTLGIFACLEEQIREKLSNIPWMPVLEGTRFALPSKVILGSQNTSQNSDSSSSEHFLYRLLVNRLDMQELDSAFLCPPSTSTTDGDEIDLLVSNNHRMQKLHRLGVQRISSDALIELASTLSEEELRQPGFLYALLANIDSGLRSFDSQPCASLSNRSAWQRRCVSNLRRLRIFPLTDGSLVSLEDAVSNDSGLLKHRNALMVPPRPPASAEKSSKIAYDEYIHLLSRLGPLVSSKAIYPPEACKLDPPRILFSANDDLSLGLTAVNSPLDVITNWIIPHQSDFNHVNAENADWFIAAAQVMVLHGDLSEHERVISRLPIVCEIEDGTVELFSPVRNVIFTPLVFLENEEYEIMSILLENRVKECPILVASSEYFDSMDCVDEEIRERWRKWFSLAGLSTIQTLCHQKYRLKTRPLELAVLPDSHPLRHSPALTEISGLMSAGVIVEDWICPGLEGLILPWIEKMSTHFGSEETVMTVCRRILALLDCNWKQNFGNCTYAIARSPDSNGPIILGASSWLRALRTHSWLAVSSLEETAQTILVAATDNKKSALSIDFTASPAIYSPEAFKHTEGSPPMPISLLNLVCHIWKPLEALGRSVNSNFLSALGIKQKLDELTFKSLVDYLYDKRQELPSVLSLDNMIQVYFLAQHVLRDSPVNALCRLFSSAILVPCTDTRNARKKRRIVGSLGSSDDGIECPIYCFFCDYQSTIDLKRTFPMGVNFHLVSADRTCWQAARLPSLKSNPDLEDDIEEVLVKVPIPNVNPISPKPPRLNNSEVRVELSKIYKDDCKSFFCDILKVPLTSSLPEVLSLRPLPPKFQSTLQWQVAQETFGRTLGAWYALIYRCLEKNTDNYEQMDQLRNFPLLYDMLGAWRTPCNLNSQKMPFTSEDGLLFCWSAVDLAHLVPQKCVLGHCLDILAANADEDVSLSLGGVPDSHSLLLNVLGLPVLEKSVSVNLKINSANQAPNPSKKLDASLKFFRLLTKVWLASTNAKSSRSIVSEFVSTPRIGLEAFLVQDLTLRLQLSNSTFGWTIPNIPCRFCSRNFYVDSKFELDLGLNTYDDELFLFVGGREPIGEKILIELTRAVFPKDLRYQLLLLNFSNGLLSLRSSLLTSGLSGTDVANHLRTFLISHGVPSSNRSLNDLLSRLTSGMLPTVSTNVVEVLPVRGASVSAITAHSESVTIAPRRTSTQSGDDNTGVGCYTRFQTPMFEAIAAAQRKMFGSSKANSLRSSLSEENNFTWKANSEEASDFNEIGRKGEETVYENYLKRIKEGREFDFATGHPDLGLGRLIEAEWVNGSGESREPYDIIVYLEVKGSIDSLDSSINEEVTAGVIRRSPNSKDMLRVGPIFVEVKSTRVTSAPEEFFKERADLFEISLAEASYARTIGWRYHIARFRMIRDGRSEIQHIPNLALALAHDPRHFKLYVGMKG